MKPTVVPIKSKVNISQNFVAFSEYMNFNVWVDKFWSQGNSFVVINSIIGTSLKSQTFSTEVQFTLFRLVQKFWN